MEALEPRWLLSTTETTWSELDLGARLGNVSELSEAAITLSAQVVSPDDWTKAQRLPDADTVYVKGAPTQGTLPDLLEVHVDRDTATVHFTLKSAWGDRPVAESLQVFDSKLNTYASFDPNPSTQSYDISIPMWPGTSSTLYVKIALPSGIGTTESFDPQDSDSFAYIMQITRVRNNSQPQGPTDETLPGIPSGGSDLGGAGGYEPGTGTGRDEATLNLPPRYPSDPEPTSGPSSPPAGPAPAPPQTPKTEDDPLTIAVPVPVGPLPMRSAAPLGGALAAPESAPSVDRHEAARADLALFDPDHPLEVEDLDLRALVPTGTPVIESAGVKIIAVRGPGRLPMLATA